MLAKPRIYIMWPFKKMFADPWFRTPTVSHLFFCQQGVDMSGC